MAACPKCRTNYKASPAIDTKSRITPTGRLGRGGKARGPTRFSRVSGKRTRPLGVLSQPYTVFRHKKGVLSRTAFGVRFRTAVKNPESSDLERPLMCGVERPLVPGLERTSRILYGRSQSDTKGRSEIGRLGFFAGNRTPFTRPIRHDTHFHCPGGKR